MKTLIDVELMGERFTLQSEESEDYIIQVSKYVNEKLSLYQESLPMSSNKNVALLVALNIADELFKERTKIQKLREKIREKTSFLLELLEKDKQSTFRGDDPLQGGLNI